MLAIIVNTVIGTDSWSIIANSQNTLKWHPIISSHRDSH